RGRLEPVLREVGRVRELRRHVLQVVGPARDRAAEAARPGGGGILLAVAATAADGRDGENDDERGGRKRSAHRLDASGSEPRRGREEERTPTLRAHGARAPEPRTRRTSPAGALSPGGRGRRGATPPHVDRASST